MLTDRNRNRPGPKRINNELERLFTDPPRGFSPTPLWWWSGEEITEGRMEWQMRRFAEGGVYNLVLINLAPAGPQFDAETDDPQWFSDTWWQRIERACEVAQELGMRLWFYDQIGFSGANVQGRVTRDHPWATGSSLQSRSGHLVAGRPVLAANESVVGVYNADGDVLRTDPDGTILGSHPNAQVQLTTAVPTAFDYLDPAAVRLLMDQVHGEFDRRIQQHLGTVIAGSFQDELPASNPWTSAFLGEFNTRMGYDLHPHLPAILGPRDVQAAKVRADYHAVRAALTEEALFIPLNQWHESHGMLLGADQANPARAGLPIQSTQIYSDDPRTHRHVSALGSDHQGDAKFPASLAGLYGDERVWLEAFHSSGWVARSRTPWTGCCRSCAAAQTSTTRMQPTSPPSVVGSNRRRRQRTGGNRTGVTIARSPRQSPGSPRLCPGGHPVADVAVLHPTATMQASLPLDIPVDHFHQTSFEGAATDVTRTQQAYLDLVGKDDWFHFKPSALDRFGIRWTSAERSRAPPRHTSARRYDQVLLFARSSQRRDNSG